MVGRDRGHRGGAGIGCRRLRRGSPDRAHGPAPAAGDGGTAAPRPGRAGHAPAADRQPAGAASGRPARASLPRRAAHRLTPCRLAALRGRDVAHPFQPAVQRGTRGSERARRRARALPGGRPALLVAGRGRRPDPATHGLRRASRLRWAPDAGERGGWPGNLLRPDGPLSPLRDDRPLMGTEPALVAAWMRADARQSIRSDARLSASRAAEAAEAAGRDAGQVAEQPVPSG